MIEDSLLGLGAAGFHRISYTDWGDPAAERVVVGALPLRDNIAKLNMIVAVTERALRRARDRH